MSFEFWFFIMMHSGKMCPAYFSYDSQNFICIVKHINIPILIYFAETSPDVKIMNKSILEFIQTQILETQFKKKIKAQGALRS